MTTPHKKPSLKAEWKAVMRELDRINADVNARAVYSALWAYSDTATVNAHNVAMVYPKVSTIRDLIGVRSDKTVTKALNWLVEQGFIWRVRPHGNAKLQGRLMIGKTELHRGVCVYALIRGVSVAVRGEWARDVDGKRLKIEGGPSLREALTAPANNTAPATQTAAANNTARVLTPEEIARVVRATRDRIVDTVLHRAMDDGLPASKVMAVTRGYITAALTRETDAPTLAALRRLSVREMAAAVDELMTCGPQGDAWHRYGVVTPPPRAASRAPARATRATAR